MTEAMVKWLFRDRDGVPRSREACGASAGLVGIVCNVLLCVCKGLVGILSGSISIVADAVNNLSDAGASAVTLLSFRIAGKPADKEHPYGHARVEYLAGALIAVVVLLLGFELGKTSVSKILQPVEMALPTAMWVVLALGILGKLWLASFYKKAGAHIHSSTLAAAAQDSRNDVVATAAVLAGALVQKLTGIDVDGYVGVAVALFILWSGVSILKDALEPLIGTAPPMELVRDIRAILGEYPEILDVHDLMVHSYGPGREFASVHAEMRSSADPLESHGVLDNIERRVEEELGVKLVVHYDPVDEDDQNRQRIRQQVEGVVHAIDPRLSIHDLRLVLAHDHLNIVFDVAVPWEYEGEPEDLRRLITAGIKALDERYFAVIELDRSYAEGGAS